MTLDDLIEAWRANEVVNHELLGLCSDPDLDLKPGKDKTIRSSYVHVVGVRRRWAEVLMKKESEAIAKLDWKTATRKEIVEGLKASSKVMERVFEKMADDKKPGRWSLLTLFAYCVAHEAHHRSQVETALRINGREPDDLKLYALWEWSKKV